MKTEWLQYTVLRAASLLAPGDQRAEWVKEWRSPRCSSRARCIANTSITI